MLRKHFFRGEHAGQPVTLFVDDDLVGELSRCGDAQRGVASLAEAVRRRLSAYGGDSFARIERDSLQWKVGGGDGDPPALPLLALAVLAATHMGAADGIATHNYWRRFGDLLGTDHRTLKGREDAFPLLWSHLTWWLTERHHGELGVPTVRPHPKWTVIGYALSQALFREADRRQLTQFFLKIDLEPGEKLAEKEMLAYFRAWAPRSGLTANAKAMTADPVYESWLGAILEEEASHWDGVIRDEHGRRVARLALALETFPSPTYTLAAQRSETFPEDAVFGSASASVSLELRTPAGAWYEEMLPLDEQWLADGLRLEHEGFILAYRPATVIALGEDSDLGCWVSATRIQPGEDYYVLARSTHLEEMREFLRKWDLDGEWREISGAGKTPEGWILFGDVAIGAIPPDAEIPVPLRALVPVPRERLSFRGGLRLKRELPLYLHGGEPDLWLPSLLEDELTASVDDIEFPALPGQRIALRDLELEPGSHVARAGPGEPLHFMTVTTLGDASAEGTATLGLPIDVADDGPVAGAAAATTVTSAGPGRVWVRGATLSGDSAAVPPARETLILPLRAREYILLGSRPGEIYLPKEPKGRPDWMTSAGGEGDPGLFPYGFEVYPPFAPVWVVVVREMGADVRLRNNLGPSDSPPDNASAGDVADWSRVFERYDAPAVEAELWDEYRSAARGVPQ